MRTIGQNAVIPYFAVISFDNQMLMENPIAVIRRHSPSWILGAIGAVFPHANGVRATGRGVESLRPSKRKPVPK